MNDCSPDAQTLEVMATLLGLSIPEASKPKVIEHFQIACRMAALVREFPLDDTQDPAPVFLP